MFFSYRWAACLFVFFRFPFRSLLRLCDPVRIFWVAFSLSADS
jgi:hypothetical protein